MLVQDGLQSSYHYIGYTTREDTYQVVTIKVQKLLSMSRSTCMLKHNVRKRKENKSHPA